MIQHDETSLAALIFKELKERAMIPLQEEPDQGEKIYVQNS
jgi:hypothetical protein